MTVKRMPNARFLTLGALVLVAALSVPSTALAAPAANTLITNTATVNFNDAGGNPQPAVNASASITYALITAAPSVLFLSSVPAAPITIAQGAAATITYEFFSNANGPDTYSFTSVATPTSISVINPTESAAVALGASTLLNAAGVGDTSIRIHYDSNTTDGFPANGLAAGDTIRLAGVTYTINTITEDPVNNWTTITFPVGVTITAAGLVGDVVGERGTFTVSGDPATGWGIVTAPGPGTQSVVATATGAGAGGNAAAVVVTVTAATSQLTVGKLVSVNGGGYAASQPSGVGDTLTFQITATNVGTTNAQAVVFTDTLPSYMTYVPNSCAYTTNPATPYGSATPMNDGALGVVYTAGPPENITWTASGAGQGTIVPTGNLILFFQATVN